MVTTHARVQYLPVVDQLSLRPCAKSDIPDWGSGLRLLGCKPLGVSRKSLSNNMTMLQTRRHQRIPLTL